MQASREGKRRVVSESVSEADEEEDLVDGAASAEAELAAAWARVHLPFAKT